MEEALFEVGGDGWPDEWTVPHRMTVRATATVQDDGAATFSGVRVIVRCNLNEWAKQGQEERDRQGLPEERTVPELVDEVLPVLNRVRYPPLPDEWRGLGIVRTFEFFQLSGGTDFRKYSVDPCADAA